MLLDGSKQYWWVNLVYAQNLYPWTDTFSHECIVWTW